MGHISDDEWPNTDPTGRENARLPHAACNIGRSCLDGTGRGVYMLCRGDQYKVYAEPKLD
jgi:hypothetical protein